MISKLDPKVRAMLAVLVFLNVTCFGCLCLILTGNVVLPF